MQNRVAIFWTDQDAQTVKGNNIANNVDATNRFNGYMAQSTSGATDDSYKWNRYFEKGGLYKFRLIYSLGTNLGKINIGLDSSATYFVNSLDCYNAIGSNNRVLEVLATIPKGYHDITIQLNGKNASSSNYFFIIPAIMFDLVQEYYEGIYQDDRPLQVNQGSLVLLGRHIAAIAESTFTFNFADVKYTKYSEILIKVNGGATASLELQAVINSLNSGISQNGFTAIGASLTVVNLSSRSSIQLASTSVLTGATDFVGTILLKRNASGIWEVADCDFTGYAVGKEVTSASLGSPTLTTLNTLVIQTSTSTWKVGTEFEIYGVKTQ